MARDEDKLPPLVSGGPDGSPVEQLKLGQRVREARRKKGWTLDEASRRTGLARSTISKIENEQVSPTFDVVQKLSAGLEVDIPQLFVSTSAARSGGRRSMTRLDEGRPHPTPTYEHELLCTEMSKKRMIPFKSRIRARDISEFEGWIRHDGEEFMLVLEGEVTFHSEFYEPLRLGVGDSLYYDSSMGHACLSSGDEDALILWICTPN